MTIEQIYTKCLAQGSYYIESEGEVVIIDPLREVDSYLNMANKSNASIKYIFETHFHADFVSGHVTLSRKTNAPIIFGPNANTTFDAIIAHDLQEFKVGKLTIVVLHTPGHTMESTSYLLKDEQGKPHAIFSGDTLFLGDVGRPDLAQKSDVTQEQLAGVLFDSLRSKIMTLPDDVIVYPGHGAGSACGKNLSKETIGTIGEQKETNYALRQDMTKEEFVAEVIDGLLPPPKYFPLNVQLNRQGYEDVDDIIEKGVVALDVSEFKSIAKNHNAIILDVRNQKNFVEGFIPDSIFIGIDGGFAPWVGAILEDIKQPILLVTPIGREQETITRLARVGFDNILGCLNGSFDSWEKSGNEIDTMKSISAIEFEQAYTKDNSVPIIDVRKPGEYSTAHIQGAVHVPLSFLDDNASKIAKNQPSFLHCAGGYRSVIAISLLKRKGFNSLIDVKGGFGAIKKTGLPILESTCDS